MKILFIILISLSAFSERKINEKSIDELIKKSQSLSRIQKIKLYSKIFLDQTYRGGVLGEGEKGRFDKDPMYSFEAFDCTTYVETVLSLVNAENFLDFLKIMKEVRYNSYPSYENRNHFISLDWINDNFSFFSEYTERLPAQVYEALAFINKTAWYQSKSSLEGFGETLDIEEEKKRIKEFQGLGRFQKNEYASLPYISIEDAIKKDVIKAIPNGSIINIVRPNWDLKKYIGTHLNISHQGIIIKNKKGIFLRHASSEAGKVADMPFKDYLSRYISHKEIKGINVLVIH